MNLVWGYSYAGDYRTVDVHIRRLRESWRKTGGAGVHHDKVGSWLLFCGGKPAYSLSSA